jgi:peroxiredoxin
MVTALVVIVTAVIVYLALKPAGVKPVPDFELPRLGGGSLSSDELRGSPVVINFFAAWCAPCREEAPDLERAWRAHKADGVRFVGVVYRDTRENASRFVQEFDLTYPIVRDEQQRLARALDVNALPQTFFVTEQWELLGVARGRRLGEGPGGAVQLGAISPEELESQIGAMLES